MTRREFVQSIHGRTERDYLARMVDDKIEAMEVAGRFGSEYWDGDRRYGYGGYSYRPGYWEPVARSMIESYDLGPGSRILDVGCGKAFLLHEMLVLEPHLEVTGIDISPHALAGATELVQPHLVIADARQPLSYSDNQFDLVISLATLHNFYLREVHTALTEIERVGRVGYVMIESYRDARELFNLECWALTCRTFLSVEDWNWFFDLAGYRGDREFIFFE